MSDNNVTVASSSLALRRSAQLPKLRDLVRKPRDSIEVDAASSGDPDLDFNYEDCDSYGNELSELYCYMELDDFAANANAFNSYAKRKKMRPIWSKLCTEHQRTVTLDLIENLELSDSASRLDAVRVLLYLLQGSFMDFYAGENDAETKCLQAARSNAYLLYEMGAYAALCTALSIELDGLEESHKPSESEPNKKRKSATLADNTDLRLILCALYCITEALRSEDGQQTPGEETDRRARLRDNFKSELGDAVCGENPLPLVLFQMVTSFCAGAAPHYPMRKVLLLLWKTLLAWLGGWEQLRVAKDQQRQAAGLPVCQDTLSTAKTMRAAPPPSVPALIAAVQAAGDGEVRRRLNRPPLPQRQMASERTDSGDEDDGLPDDDDGEDEVMVDAAEEPSTNDKVMDWIDKNGNENDQNEKTEEEQPPRPDSPAPFKRVPLTSGHLTARPPPSKVLPWSPKIRPTEVESFLELERSKFLEYQLPSDRTTLFGLPGPIHESVRALNKHTYVSLGEMQAKRDDQLNRYFFSQKEGDIPQSPAEQLYRQLLPQVPQYMIALLKILLAAAPTSKAKTDAINILADVLPPDVDSSFIMTVSGSSFSLDLGPNPQNGLEMSVRISLDINRHKEVIVKAVSSILLLLLKHLRLNHIYQFEYLAQHLVFANCIPLILKFFDQNIQQYVQSKNELAAWNFPAAVTFYAANEAQWPELNLENLEKQRTDSRPGAYYLWRNLFSAINLLRVLNKLTKWKHARTMMLVVFKSAPILKRTLRVKQILLQLYALKLLKMQAKYLGRQWRKTNMEIMSAIYSKVRHRLNDDWAYGNETQSKPWDFQSEESALRSAVEKFNLRRYGEGMLSSISSNAEAMTGSNVAASSFNDPEFQPYDNNIVSVLGMQCELTDRFKLNYEKWLEREVFKANIDWDQLLQMNKGVAG